MVLADAELGREEGLLRGRVDQEQFTPILSRPEEALHLRAATFIQGKQEERYAQEVVAVCLDVVHLGRGPEKDRRSDQEL